MTQLASTMNGGDGTYSYVKNSTLQRDGLNAAKNVIKEALVENLDLNTLLASSTSAFTIADLGCSVGRNTLFAVETIIEIVQEKYDDDSSRIIGGGSKKLEFQVWFNDQTTNDFNTLFASLDGRKDKYFAAGVPGSFYGKLFPSSSVHVAYTSSSIHWLSGLPVELQDKESAAYNRGRIHYTGASVDDAVVEAYMKQFEEDMGAFLRARAEEMAGGGMVVIITPGVPDGGLVHDVGVALTFLGSILMDMVKEGLLKQDEVDSFNIPHVYPSVKQMSGCVQENGCFEIIKMEIRNARPHKEAPIDMESAIMHLRAFTEESIANHMGMGVADELFKRAMHHKSKFSNMLYSSGVDPGSQFFAVLKRKCN